MAHRVCRTPSPWNSLAGCNLGFMFLPIYRGWVVIASLVVCLSTWLIIEKTKLGAYLRAANRESERCSRPSA